MKRGSFGLLLFLAVMALPLRPVFAAEPEKPAAPEQKPAEPAEKPLEPGWLSLDCCVGVMDKAIANGKGALEGALGIGISGFLDTGYTWSSNHPGKPANISGRYFDKDYNKIVFNDFHLALDKPEKDWGVGFHISGDFGRAGELLREATYWGGRQRFPSAFRDEPSVELREAFVTTTIPVGEGIALKGGLMVTPLGTEILPNPGAYNDNISRSLLFNFAIPLRHLGMMASYPLLKTLTVQGGIFTGWDDPYDNNNQPSFHVGATFTPNDWITFVSNFLTGPEQWHRNGPKRHIWANVLTVKPMDLLALSFEYDYGHEGNVTPSGRDGTWQGWAGIASYSWTDRFTTAFRGEVFRDSDGVRTGVLRDLTAGEITFTGSYKFTKMLIGRAEIRQDWASKNVIAKGSSGGADKNQTTLAMQLIYTY
jgi:hypothetical protein